MATIVCQGLEPVTLRLKLSSPKPKPHSLELTLKPQSKTHINKPEDAKSGGGGWSFLQALSPPNNTVTKDKEEVYVHPLVKRIQASLSDKSLAMCTENLGSETGSDDMVPDLDTLFSRSYSESPIKEKKRKTRKQSNFPPPLTTISGSECLRIRAHREDGRMVMEAVKGPSSNTCFRSDRSHGRLRLYFLENSTLQMDPQGNQCEYGEEEEEEERVESENDTLQNSQEKFKQQEEEAEETEHGVEESEGGSDMDGNNIKFGGKMGIGECQQRPRRCREGEMENELGTLLGGYLLKLCFGSLSLSNLVFSFFYFHSNHYY